MQSFELSELAMGRVAGSTGFGPTSVVHHVKYVTLGTHRYLVLAGTFGVYVFDSAGSRTVYHMSVEGMSKHTPKPVTHACSAAAAASADGSGQLCVGTSAGLVLIFDCSNRGRISHSGAARGSVEGVVALGSGYDSCQGQSLEEPPLLAGGDLEGNVKLWAAESAERYVEQASAENAHAVTALRLRGSAVFCALADGGLKVYDAGQGLAPKLEVRAHSRWNYCMDMHPERNLLVTGSNDSTVSVWEFPDDGTFSLGPLKKLRWTDAMVTGVSFCDTVDGIQVFASAYDFRSLAHWSLAG